MHKHSKHLTTQAVNTISLWRDIELFNFPDIDPVANFYPYGATLPWEIQDIAIPNSKWQHTIYLGRITKKEANCLILNAFAINTCNKDWKEDHHGNTFMAVMIVNQHGQLEENGFMPACYTIASNCIQNNVPLTAIEHLLTLAIEQHGERLQVGHSQGEKHSLQVDWIHLKAEQERLRSAYSHTVTLSEGIWIKSIPVHESSISETAFLNSFYLKDLNSLLHPALRKSKGILKLLTSEDPINSRVDILKDTNAFRESIDPVNLSPGRWPFNPSNGLYSTQLSALNTTLKNLKTENGISSIHNPPGTGKSTILADMIADSVVHRAIALINSDLDNLFEKTPKITQLQHRDYIYYPAISRIFKDAGIVVACNNEAAADNITRDLILDKRIDTVNFPQAGYFTEQASGINVGSNWGCIAAALGNPSSNQAFKTSFWLSSPGKKGFLALLTDTEDPIQQSDQLEKYNTAKQELNTLLKEFEEFKSTAISFHQLVPEMSKNQEKLKNANEKLFQIRNSIISRQTENEKLKSLIEKTNFGLFVFNNKIEQHTNNKPQPFFIHQLFATQKHEQWKTDYNKLHETVTPLRRNLRDLVYSLRIKSSEIYHLHQKATEAEVAVKLYEDKILHYKNSRDYLHNLTGIAYSNIPDVTFYADFEDDQKQLHQTSPWSSVEINTLRSKIFLCSLKVHEHAILYHSKAIKNNLSMLMDMLEGSAIFSEATAQGLWRTFFFCVPAVTTTLSSAPRIFNKLGTESIGWLLIDEAGQATPQSTAGLINRAQKCIIIGDPMQAQPIKTIDAQLIEKLRQTNQTDHLWSPNHNSIQTLADRVTPTGTTMTINEGHISWLGFPLRSHNRCYEPMFSLANGIAYKNNLIKLRSDAAFRCAAGPSQWFDVKSGTAIDNQVIQEEIELLKLKLIQPGMELNKIFIISPFKHVAIKCSEEFAPFSFVTCGTIHTFQGRTADLVFLVLGSNRQTPEAREWASKTSHFLNSALTRATKRFYVIGNKELWRKYKYFENLAQQL